MRSKKRYLHFQTLLADSKDRDTVVQSMLYPKYHIHTQNMPTFPRFFVRVRLTLLQIAHTIAIEQGNLHDSVPNMEFIPRNG